MHCAPSLSPPAHAAALMGCAGVAACVHSVLAWWLLAGGPGGYMQLKKKAVTRPSLQQVQGNLQAMALETQQ